MPRWRGKDLGPAAPRGRGEFRSTGEGGRLRAILEAALRAFARQGFAHTPVAEVAAAAGVASGTIIYHFQTKENLLAILVWESLHQLYHRCSSAVQAAPPGPARARAYAEAYFDLLRQEPDRVLLLLKTRSTELAGRPMAPDLDIRTLWQACRRLLVDIFRESPAAGPANGPDPDRMASALLAQLSGAAWLHLFFNEDLDALRASALDLTQALYRGSAQS